MRKKVYFVILIIAVLCTGILVGSKIFENQNEQVTTEEDFPFLAKRLFVENPNDVIINFSPLRTSLNQYFDNNNLNGSLYFEYLPTGTSIRINGSDEFRAASLIKLPVAMELYKAASKGLVNLDDKVALKQEWLNDGFGSLYEKGAGYELTLGELAEILLKESDNTALRAVIEATADLEINDRALGALDVEFSQTDSGEISIGSRSYGSFLKCLYFACYNSKEDSQAILEHLSNTGFDERLVAGVPNNVTVSHKIGVFNNQVQGDCGIIYLKDRNYILCLMLEGAENPTTDKHFESISKIIYEFVESQ
jgi:beta-lactamase class A